MDTKKETAAGLEGVSQAERSLLTAVPSGSRSAEQELHSKRGAEAAQSDKERPKRNQGVRILLWLLRKSVVPALCVIAIVGGMCVGYVTIGKGSVSDVFNLATWKHMYDLVFADS
ncbi:DNA-directed RNA polymerase subunit beta [Paenibacillus solisilvae]|uniref:DNA-directed RNA polymerase subunit beta n=1 Tax=Paenibacillus solisilvae TaxID=2486751 RepID=A0ABW0W5I9_9BACL